MKKGEKEKKEKSQNRYKMLVTRVMQCRVRGKVEVRQQEKVGEEVKCFRYWKVGYQKWEYPNIGVERERREKKEVVCIVRPQKMQ